MPKKDNNHAKKSKVSDRKKNNAMTTIASNIPSGEEKPQSNGKKDAKRIEKYI